MTSLIVRTKIASCVCLGGLPAPAISHWPFGSARRGRQKDRSKTDKRVDNPFEWPTGRRREQVTHYRQAYTAGCDQHDAPRAQKASRHQDNGDVQNRERYVHVSHRVSDEDGNGGGGGRDGKNESGRVASRGCRSHRLSPVSLARVNGPASDFAVSGYDTAC
jgi:hypothetical protein